MSPTPPTMDPCISYGRGGAGNMRRRSSILDAWSKISSQQPSSSSPDQTTLFSSPDDHYASSKSEPRMSTSSNRRRASSMWSSSTAAGERRWSVWRRWFRRGSVAENENENGTEVGDKVVESE